MSGTPTRFPRRRLALAALAVLGLVATGCTDDDVDDAANAAVDLESDSADAANAGDARETVEVTAVDYAFEGVPPEVEAGTTFTLTNESEVEVHEIVLLKLKDGEERPLDELLQLPREEQAALSELQGVALAFPGEDAAFSQGSLVPQEPGRYVLICTIPQGADPQALREAASDPESEGPPDADGGPPHFLVGMASEVQVR